MFRRKKRSVQDFAEEIRSHLELEADQLRGGSPDDADAQARRSFGNVMSFQERFYERGRWLLWDNIIRDLRHARRMMKSGPGFSAVVILTLALGIGANTAIFSLIHAVLLRPLPYKDPGRLAMLWVDDPAHNDAEGLVSLADFRDWKAQSRTFEDMTMFRGQTFLLGSDGSPERARSARVPANFFAVMGVAPKLGRIFSTDEEKRGERLVVVSYRLWQRRFGGSARALGSDLAMDGRKSRIIGVMPQEFQFPFSDTQVWEPMTTHPYWLARDWNALRTDTAWFALGRVKRDADWGHARAEMSTIARRLQQPGINIVPLQEQTTGKVALPLTALFASVFLVLLIACMNVANLLLARGAARDREFAVRRALGAGRMRLAGQLFTESAVLSLAGGALGLGLAAIGLRALIAFGPRDIPRLAEARLDPEVLLFTLAISLFAAAAAGMWPAVQNSARLGGGRSWAATASRGVRSVLVIGELALALVLLTGAGLLVRSFVHLVNVDPGFRPANLLSMRIDLHVGKTAPQREAYFREAVERAATVPGVSSAAAIGRFLKSYGEEPVAIEGRPVAAGQTCKAADDVITGPYFQTASIALRGRSFTRADRGDSLPVAIINEAMARNCWPHEDPIGKRVSFTDRKPNLWITVVGVAGDMHRQGLEKQVAPQIFRPHAQGPDNEMDLLVRTSGDSAALAGMVRDAVRAIDKNVAKFGITTVKRQLGDQTAERRFQTSLLGLFSVIAMALSAIGIYGLIHHLVQQRTQEIGVRMALGAARGDVVRLVLRQGLTLAAMGTAVGICGALGLTRMLSSLLFGVGAADPVTFAAAPVILLGAAAVACWLPARRAARIDPVLALRAE